jgi:hypothetical protein
MDFEDNKKDNLLEKAEKLLKKILKMKKII